MDSDGLPLLPTSGRQQRLAAVLGHPIAHSRSPALHAAAYRVLGLDFTYTAIDVSVDKLPDLMHRVRTEPGWSGLSVTMPLKAAVVALLDEVTPTAAGLGVVNTVTFAPGPHGPLLTGHNTDAGGLVDAFRHANLTGMPKAAVLGGGGTATAAIAALATLGASTVDLYVRDPARARTSADAAARAGLSCTVLDFRHTARRLADYDAVICTLPPRAADGLASELASSAPTAPGGLLLDAAYDPWPSALALAWEQHGGRAISGLEMLLYQAVEQVRLFTGDPAAYSPAVLNAMCDAIGLPRR